IVSGRLAVAHLDLHQHQEEALVLDVAVGPPHLPQQFGPALLEVDQVVRMVQEAHAVGLGVADADGNLAGHGRVSRSPPPAGTGSTPPAPAPAAAAPAPAPRSGCRSFPS